MLLTLIIVPVVYLAVDVLKEKAAARKERKAEKELAYPTA
jgi:hypothetical protein